MPDTAAALDRPDAVDQQADLVRQIVDGDANFPRSTVIRRMASQMVST